MLPYALLFFIYFVFTLLKKQISTVFIFILILFIGLRYDVGADYLSYEKIFYYIKDNADLPIAIEPGYSMLNQLVSCLGGNFVCITLAVAFLQLFFFFKAIKKFEYKKFAIFFFLVSFLGLIVNEMRQYIAVMIFFYSLRYIYNKCFLKYLLFVLLAGLFHYSALALIPLYFILNIKLSSFLYVISYLVLLVITSFIHFDGVLLSLLSLSGYSDYLNSDFIEATSLNGGLGFLFKNILGGIILYNYKKCLERFDNYRIYFNLYFMFLLFRNLFFSIGILMRFTAYFQISEVIVYPLFIYSFFLKDGKVMLPYFFIIAFLCLCFWGIMNPENHILYQSIFS